MFSSLASFIFGSNTSATTNSEANQNPRGPEEDHHHQLGAANVRIDAENTIEVTSRTPSVTGTGHNSVVRINKRGRNKRSRNNKNKKSGQGEQKPAATSITKLLTPSDSFDEDNDDDDWFIVEKEDDEDESLPRTDSEEELSLVELKSRSSTPFNNASNNTVITSSNNANNNSNSLVAAQQQQRRRQHINSHSLYSGPRPQQQRNFLQRSRNSGARGGVALNVSTLSPPRSIAGHGVAAAAADGGITQSLFVVPANRNESGHNTSGSGSENGNNSNVSLMDGSWFVTPPPCFTSIGPIHMETSPFENLLIEHPSMSVYHSIRTAQEATESFVNLDLGVEESQQRRVATPIAGAAPAAAHNGRNNQAANQRSSSIRIDQYNATQLKQELFARKAQKSRDKKERQSLCRGAIKRANKVRDFQAKGNRQRRSDMQHCKILSGANNNRKSCF